MKFRIGPQMLLPTRTQSFLRWSRYILFIIGILTLGYCGFVLLDTTLYQAYQTWRFEQTLKDQGPPVGGDERPQPSSLTPALMKGSRAIAPSVGTSGRGGSPLGRIEISTLGLRAMILEGTDERTLQRAVGHIAGTALPGQPGNVAIAGHRDTFFRALRNIRTNDEIKLTTLEGSYRYLVDSTKVVEPEATEVLDSSTDAILTLVTCYPFYFVGPAPQRFVVRAHRID